MPLTEAGATALSAGLGFMGQTFGSTASGLFGANQARKNRQFQERMYNKQVEDTINFWNMQNEYNLPSAQLQRLRDAGLNPLLMYGEGGISGNIASQQPSLPSAPHGAQGSAHISTNIDMANLALLHAQIENMKADSELKRAEAGESGSRTKMLDFDLSYKMDTQDVQKAILDSQYDLNRSMESLNRENRIYISKQSEKVIAEINSIVQAMENAKNLTEAQINDINERLAGFNKQLPHIIANLDAQAREYLANAYAAMVSANIQKQLMTPEYIKILQGKEGQEFLNAVRYGDGLAIENGLKAIEYQSTPKDGDAYYNYGRFMKYGVSPMLDVLKDAAIGAGSLYFLKGAGGKVAKIGFVK